MPGAPAVPEPVVLCGTVVPVVEAGRAVVEAGEVDDEVTVELDEEGDLAGGVGGVVEGSASRGSFPSSGTWASALKGRSV